MYVYAVEIMRRGFGKLRAEMKVSSHTVQAGVEKQNVKMYLKCNMCVLEIRANMRQRIENVPKVQMLSKYIQKMQSTQLDIERSGNENRAQEVSYTLIAHGHCIKCIIRALIQPLKEDLIKA